MQLILLVLIKDLCLFDLVYSIVFSPAPVTTTSGFYWFLIFVHDCNRMTWLYLMKSKSDVFECFWIFHKMIKTLFSATLKVLC